MIHRRPFFVKQTPFLRLIHSKSIETLVQLRVAAEPFPGASATNANILASLPSDKLTCPICYETFADDQDMLQPRRLSCEHIVCTGCLEAELCDNEVTCPECFSQTECESIEALVQLRVAAEPSSGASSTNTNNLPSLPSDKTTCPICYETFADDPDMLQPRRLSCEHIACTGCLEAELCDDEVTCPECFSQTQCESVCALQQLCVTKSGTSTSATITPAGRGTAGSGGTSSKSNGLGSFLKASGMYDM